MNHQQGMSLVELLIGFFLSTLLILILMQHVILVKQQSRMMVDVIEESLDLQWLSDFFQHRVRSAGFTPCQRLDHLVRFDARQNPEPFDILTIQTTPYPRLTLRRMSDEHQSVLQQISSTEILVESTSLKKGRPVLISDCVHAEVHDIADRIIDDQKQRVILKEPLMFQYEKPFYVGEWVTESFFVRRTPITQRGLYYEYHRVDQLTERVHDFSAEVESIKGYTLLHSVFQLNDHRAWMVDTLVRIE